MGKGKALAKDFDPSEYEFIGYFYCGTSDDIGKEYSSDHSYLSINHPDVWVAIEDLELQDLLGKCQSCGTWFAHGAIYTHTPTGEPLFIGQQCAEEYFSATSVSHLRTREAAKAKAKRELAEKVVKWLGEHPEVAEAFNGPAQDAEIIQSIKAYLIRNGFLTDRQVETVLDVHEKWGEAETWTREPELLPVETHGSAVEIEGKVLHQRIQETMYGAQRKMLLWVGGDDAGFKLWGTVPRALGVPYKGDIIRMTVSKVEVSSDDESFGFYSRPRNAEYVSQVEREVDKNLLPPVWDKNAYISESGQPVWMDETDKH